MMVYVIINFQQNDLSGKKTLNVAITQIIQVPLHIQVAVSENQRLLLCESLPS